MGGAKINRTEWRGRNIMSHGWVYLSFGERRAGTLGFPFWYLEYLQLNSFVLMIHLYQMIMPNTELATLFSFRIFR